MPLGLEQLTIFDQSGLADRAVRRAEHGCRILGQRPRILPKRAGEEVVEAEEVVELLALGLVERHAVGPGEAVNERLADPGYLRLCQRADEPGQLMLWQESLQRCEPGAHGWVTGVSSRLPHSDQDP